MHTHGQQPVVCSLSSSLPRIAHVTEMPLSNSRLLAGHGACLPRLPHLCGMKQAATPGNMPGSTWAEVPAGSDFPIGNIPFGVAAGEHRAPRPCTRIGDQVVDLGELADAGLLDGLGISPGAFLAGPLNPLLEHGKAAMRGLRARIAALLAADNGELRDNGALREKAIRPVSACTMHLPVAIGDYTDFYSSREHATNVGTMFRGAENALMPNWLHLPVCLLFSS